MKTNPILSEWDIYGSAAHGKFAIRQPKEELAYEPLEYDRGSQFYRIVGEKQYHLTDHLGNVRATVSIFCTGMYRIKKDYRMFRFLILLILPIPKIIVQTMGLWRKAGSLAAATGGALTAWKRMIR